MRPFGTNITEIAQIPDTVGAVLLPAAGAAVAQDWPTGRYFVEFDSSVNLYINMASTYAAAPTSNSSGTTLSSGWNIRQQTGHQHVYRIPSGSTGYSLAGDSSGVCTISFWSI